jgi:hypothetical protein
MSEQKELFVKDLPETLRGLGRRFPKLITTMAVGEEGDQPTTMAVGEEGDGQAVIAAGWVATTMAVGEEGDGPTTMAVGEEGGEQPVPALMHGTINACHRRGGRRRDDPGRGRGRRRVQVAGSEPPPERSRTKPP